MVQSFVKYQIALIVLDDNEKAYFKFIDIFS